MLEYHISPNNTLYSTSYEPAKGKANAALEELYDSESVSEGHSGCTRHQDEAKSAGWFDRFLPHKPSNEGHSSPKHKKIFRHVHIDLPTALENHALPVDIFRRGPFVNLRVNGFVPVIIQDGLAKDGVIHVVPRVLIPPKKPGAASEEVEEGQMSVQELVERLEPFVKKSSEEEQNVIEDGKWEF